MADGPLEAYRARRASGELDPDQMQALGAEKLQSLHNALRDYTPSSGGGGWRERLGLARRKETAPQGLYLFGGVGRGKSMLMDLFFETAPVEKKRRVHFHAFMLEVQDTLHGRRQRKEEDPLPKIAADIAADTTLICFDEFQVENIADAMILARLFGTLFDLGVVVVATSNTAPDQLYKDGLQRGNFLPFIDLVKQRLDVLELDSGVDYRRARLKDMRLYHTPLGAEANAALDDAFDRLTDGATPEAMTLIVQARDVAIPAAARGVARFDFASLCEEARGTADYLEIARTFHTLIVDRIPVLRREDRNAARRFINLIDALYEHRSKLVCSAAAAPDALYPDGDGAQAFQRAVSRILEMQGEEYLAEEHSQR